VGRHAEESWHTCSRIRTGIGRQLPIAEGRSPAGTAAGLYPKSAKAYKG